MILLCGLPGSGKTTLAKRLAREVPAVRLSPDEWLIDLGVDLFDEPFRERLEGRFRKLARDLLGLGQNVVLESGFRSRAERDEMRAVGRAVGALVEPRYLVVPFVLPEPAVPVSGSGAGAGGVQPGRRVATQQVLRDGRPVRARVVRDAGGVVVLTRCQAP